MVCHVLERVLGNHRLRQNHEHYPSENEFLLIVHTSKHEKQAILAFVALTNLVHFSF